MAQSSADKKNNTRAVSMDVLSLLRLLARHWRVTAPAALLTLVGLVGVVKVSAPTYNATGSIVLLNPREAPDLENEAAAQTPSEIGQNPFTRYGDIAIVTDILTRKMNSDSKRDELAKQGVADYSIVTSDFTRDPVFEITGQGPDAASAMRSTEIVLDEASTVLSELQVEQGADPEYLISSTPLEAPSTATAMFGSTMRAAIAVLAVGALGTLGLAVLAEIVGQRRAASQSPSRRGDADADAGDRVDTDVEHGVVGVVEAAESNGSARRRGDAAAGDRVDIDVEEEVVEAGSNGSARRPVDADADGEPVAAVSKGSAAPREVDPDAEEDGEAVGSNGSAAPPEVDSDAEEDVVAVGSNGSAWSHVDAGAGADDEAVEAATNGSADASGSPVVPGSARSRAAGRGLGLSAANRSFNSARIVPDGSPRATDRDDRNGSPAWGRAAAPLGRRPHRRPSLPEASKGSTADDQRDRSTPDR
jgi:hypothetical protein